MCFCNITLTKCPKCQGNIFVTPGDILDSLDYWIRCPRCGQILARDLPWLDLRCATEQEYHEYLKRRERQCQIYMLREKRQRRVDKLRRRRQRKQDIQHRLALIEANCERALSFCTSVLMLLTRQNRIANGSIR